MPPIDGPTAFVLAAFEAEAAWGGLPLWVADLELEAVLPDIVDVGVRDLLDDGVAMPDEDGEGEAMELLEITAGLFVQALTIGGGAGENIFLAARFALIPTMSLPASLAEAAPTTIATPSLLAPPILAAGEPSRAKPTASV